jgi:hypothetical protein
LQLLRDRDQSWRWQADDEAGLRRRIATVLAEAEQGELIDADLVFAELEREAGQASAGRLSQGG